MRSPASLSQHRAVLAHERSQNHLDALLDFGVGQRAFGRLERQPQREADSAVRHALARVPIEHANADHRRRRRRARRQNVATNDLGRQGVIDHNRKIPDNERMTRQRPHGVALFRSRGPRGIQVDLRHKDRVLARRAPAVGDGRRELSDHAERRSAGGDGGGVTRHQIRGSGRRKTGRHADGLGEAFDDAFDVEEVHVPDAVLPVFVGGAGPRDRDAPGFAARRESCADFEEGDVAAAVPAIVRDGIDEPGQQGRPQRVELCR